MRKNETLTEKCKSISRNAFIKLGNMAVGNPTGNDRTRRNVDPIPFSWPPMWVYEKPAPKRRSK